jgi:hypothetical protein
MTYGVFERYIVETPEMDDGGELSVKTWSKE